MAFSDIDNFVGHLKAVPFHKCDIVPYRPHHVENDRRSDKCLKSHSSHAPSISATIFYIVTEHTFRGWKQMEGTEEIKLWMTTTARSYPSYYNWFLRRIKTNHGSAEDKRDIRPYKCHGIIQ